MTASDEPNKRMESDLGEQIERAQLELEVASARLKRLLTTAFEDGERACRMFWHLSRVAGTEEAIAIVENRAGILKPRELWFGFLRGSLFARGDRVVANEALWEVPEAAHDREKLAQRVGDLMQARGNVLAKRTESRPEERETARARNGGRERPR